MGLYPFSGFSLCQRRNRFRPRLVLGTKRNQTAFFGTEIRYKNDTRLDSRPPCRRGWGFTRNGPRPIGINPPSEVKKRSKPAPSICSPDRPVGWPLNRFSGRLRGALQVASAGTIHSPDWSGGRWLRIILGFFGEMPEASGMRSWLFCAVIAATAPAAFAAESLTEIRRKAEAGDAVAQFGLGLIYHEGVDVPKNTAEAIKWILKAAEHSDAQIQFNLALMYYDGRILPKDSAEGARWLRKVAESDPKAAFAHLTLGQKYREGDGLPRDYAEAVKWFRKSAELGNPDAQFLLGYAYSQGEGVAKDSTEAVRWYRRASEGGNPTAQFNLGVKYFNGEGVPRDRAESVRWFRKAAEQGMGSAQFYLGASYFNGDGVPKDFVQAHVWINLAAASGEVASRMYLMNLEQEMTPEQKAEAMKLAREKWAELEAKKK